MSYLSLIRYKNYRNLKDQDIKLSNKLNLFVGPNGSGKTNILESVSLLAPGRGFKKLPLDKITKINTELPWVIYSKYIKNDIEYNISITYEKKENKSTKKKFLVNGQKEEKKNLIKFKPIIIWFIPEMEKLFNDQPFLRRNFIDRITYSFDPTILKLLNLYKKLINERNEILKRNNNFNWLDNVEGEIAKLGLEITKKRHATIKIINNTFEEIESKKISIDKCILKYISNKNKIDLNEISIKKYKEELIQSRKEDLIKGGCKIGPHKSDIEVYFTKNSLEASYCSTAQQKEIILNILLCQCHHLINHYNISPIVLLDEVCSHLDVNTRTLILKLTNWLEIQVLLTGTDESLFSILSKKANFF